MGGMGVGESESLESTETILKQQPLVRPTPQPVRPHFPSLLWFKLLENSMDLIGKGPFVHAGAC